MNWGKALNWISGVIIPDSVQAKGIGIRALWDQLLCSTLKGMGRGKARLGMKAEGGRTEVKGSCRASTKELRSKSL